MVIPLAPLPTVWLVETIAFSWTEAIPAGRLASVAGVETIASKVRSQRVMTPMILMTLQDLRSHDSDSPKSDES